MRLPGSLTQNRALQALWSYLPGWIIVLACLVALFVAERQSQRIDMQAQRADVQMMAGHIRSRLEGAITADVQLMRGLVAALEQRPDMDQEAFSALAARALGDKSHFLNIAVAPDFVVRLVHPVAPNASVIGLDYRTNAAQREAALRVRDSGVFVLAGPVALVQGGTGFIGRFPMFRDTADGRAFAGIVSAVIDAEAIYRLAGFDDPDLGLQLALRGADGQGASGAVFAGDPALFASNPVLVDIALPEGAWQLAASPVGGWRRVPANLWSILFVILGLGVLVSVPTFIALRLSKHRDDVIRDLLTHKQKLEAQRQELLRLSLVAEHASDSIILSDGRGRITWVNAAFTETTGYTMAEALGKRPSELLDGPETDPATVARIAQAIRSGRRVRTEVLNYTKAGERIWLETYLAPVLDDRGKVSFVVSVERNITEARKHATELSAARVAAEEADRVKSEFLANMSHEIRTPINGILGMAEILGDYDLPEDPKRYVSVIQESAEGLLQIINDILDLSRLESGKMTISPTDFDLEGCISAAIRLVGPAAREKGLALHLDLHDDLPARVHADDTRLRQILLNLLGNAIKFTEHGSVTLRVWPDPDTPLRLHFEVQDTGIGMSSTQAARVFDRFSQADATTTRSFGGSGLGLTITRHLVTAMQGEIGLSSQQGQGTRVRFDLTVQAAERPAPPPVRADAAAAISLDGFRVLLAEDNRTNRMLVHLYLSNTGAEILDAHDGEEAVQMCDSVKPDLILMDMSMPRLDGLSATRQIRARAAMQPPIIALTANAYDSDRKACLDAGMDGFLSKPLKRHVLLREVAAQLGVLDKAAAAS